MNITVFQALKEGEQQLLLHQVPDARLDAEYLLAGVLNLPRLSLLIEKQKILSREEYAAYRSFLDRRASGSRCSISWKNSPLWAIPSVQTSGR